MQQIDFKEQLNRLAANQKQERQNVSKKVSGVVYTTILHQRREALGLSLAEYCVADYIYHLSNAPRSRELGGWCFASKQHIGDCLSIGKKTVDRAVSRLVDIGLLEKDENTKFLRTGEKWYSQVVTYKNSKKT
jgi:DNA-binding MarR family transcriptional regulator